MSSPLPPSPSTSTTGTSFRRGRVIQYNPAEGRGVVSADAAQYPFSITEWHGAEAPQLNRVVDVEVNNGALTSVIPVAESVLLNEKASELKAKVSGVIGSQIGTDGTALGQNLLAFLSKEMLVGYAVFFIATVFLSFVTINFVGSQGFTLYRATGLMDGMSGSSYRLALYVAYLSIAVPLVWRNSRAWLAAALPLLVLVFFGWALHHYTSSAMDAANSAANSFGGLMGGMMQAQAERASKMISYGLGAYASVVSALYLAYLGVRKYIARAA